MSYELFKQGPAAWVPALIITLIITIFAYGVFPMVFSLTYKKKIVKKKFRKCCYVVNFIIMIVFIAVNGASSGFPYILWTEIFVRWGLRILGAKGSVVNHEACVNLPSNINCAINQDGYCSACGAVLSSDDDMCGNCGAKIGKIMEPRMKAIHRRDDFVDENGWGNEIASLNSDEIYRRYRDKEEWSKDYRALCYEELVKRQEVST